MAFKGARRLSDRELIERVTPLGAVLAVADEDSCPEELRGGQGDMERALDSLDRATLRKWYGITVAAMVAEHEGKLPARPDPSEEEVGQAILAVVTSLPEEEAGRFVSVVEEGGESFKAVSDADACWWFRTTVAAMPSIAVRHQQTIARLLVAE